MKKRRLQLLLTIMLAFASVGVVSAQCSICTKTAGQLGEKKAQSLNSGIVYLMLTPFVIAGYIGFRWWKGEKEMQSNEQ